MNTFNYKSKLPISIIIILVFQSLVALFISGWDIILFGIFALTGIFILSFRLKVSATQDAFSYQLTPFHFSAKCYKYDEIEWVKFIQIDALGDFWGWGLRYNKKYSWSYVLEGNMAMQIQFKDNKKRLFCFENTDELKAIFTEKALLKNKVIKMF